MSAAPGLRPQRTQQATAGQDKNHSAPPDTGLPGDFPERPCPGYRSHNRFDGSEVSPQLFSEPVFFAGDFFGFGVLSLAAAGSGEESSFSTFSATLPLRA